MSTLKITFNKCVQDSQEYGSDNEHMVSKVFFSLNGKDYECIIRQPYGESFSFENDPVEVESPDELKKLMNYGQFRDEVEKYYRNLVGSQAKAIGIHGGQGIRMTNNTFIISHTVEIDEAEPSGAW